MPADGPQAKYARGGRQLDARGKMLLTTGVVAAALYTAKIVLKSHCFRSVKIRLPLLRTFPRSLVLYILSTTFAQLFLIAHFAVH